MVREWEKRKGSDGEGSSCVWWSGNRKKGREVMNRAAVSGGQGTGKQERK